MYIDLFMLVDTAGGKAVFKVVQSLDTTVIATYVGRGKAEELAANEHVKKAYLGI